MASPQKENGHTQIANELLMAILGSDLTLRELKIILTVIRFTYGFQRKEAELAVRFLSKATNIKFHHVSEVLKSLATKNLIQFKNSINHKQGRIIIFNKDYDTWKINSSLKSNGLLVYSSRKSNGTVPKEVTETVPKKVTKKENNKENIKDIYRIEFFPSNLNGELFIKTKFFFVTKSLVNDIIKKHNITLPIEEIKSEFFRMETWLIDNKQKGKYEMFFINWLKKANHNYNRFRKNNSKSNLPNNCTDAEIMTFANSNKYSKQETEKLYDKYEYKDNKYRLFNRSELISVS